MSDRKFFSGLTAGQMTRQYPNGPNRQRTNFYWPDETDSEQFVPSRNKMRNRSLSTASLMSQSQASTDTEESKRRRSQQNESKIEFYDMADMGTDTESVYSAPNDPLKRKKQETLKSRIEFYDYVDTRSQHPDDDVQSVIERPIKRNSEPVAIEHKITVTSEKSQKADANVKAQVKSESQMNNVNVQNISQGMQNMKLSPEPQNGFMQSYAPPEKPRKKASNYVDSCTESDDDERFYRSRNHVMEDRKYMPPQQPRYPPSQRSIRSHPRRNNSEYFDFDDDVYDRTYDSANRRLRYRKTENVPRMARRRDYSPDLSDEEPYENFDGYRRGSEYSRSRPPPSPERFRSNAGRINDTDSYYHGRPARRSSANGYASEMDFQRNTSTPARRTSPQNQNNHQDAPPNGYGSEMEPQMPTAARPPVKPLTRTMSINEARQRHHVNLKSNIFHTDPEYNVLVEQRKPLSVRDFAARQRVGVGLPDI